METTILISILIPFGINMVSNITYDLIKSKGTGILNAFKKRFVNKKDFSNNSDAEEFLQYISESKVANKDDAEKNAKSWYEKRTGQQDSQEFIKELVEWIKENQKQFSDLSMTNVQGGIFNTGAGTQNIIGDVTTNNTTIGRDQITNNNYGNPSNDPQDEKKNS